MSTAPPRSCLALPQLQHGTGVSSVSSPSGLLSESAESSRRQRTSFIALHLIQCLPLTLARTHLRVIKYLQKEKRGVGGRGMHLPTVSIQQPLTSSHTKEEHIYRSDLCFWRQLSVPVDTFKQARFRREPTQFYLKPLRILLSTWERHRSYQSSWVVFASKKSSKNVTATDRRLHNAT